MGNFFVSTQMHNPKLLDRSQFIDAFCKEMSREGYVPCDSDESEISYILKFAENCKWVTITSEAYEQGNQTSQKDTGRIAKMLNTACINTVVIDSDCAVMDLYDESGKKVDTLIMGRADDYFGDDIPQPLEQLWEPFLADESTWEQFNAVRNGDYIFIEDGLSKLAPVIGMDSHNITFTAEDADECDKNVVFLDFKKARSAITMSQGGKAVEKPPKALTINAAFRQIFGEALEPFGFKVLKGRYPYLVRVINNEILHIITFCPGNPDYPPDKAFEILGGVATIYRKRIALDLSPRQNHEWFNYVSSFYASLIHETDAKRLGRLYKSCYYSNNPESLVTALKEGVENVKKYVLPVLDKVNDIDSCLDYLDEFKMPRNTNRCKEICSYYPNDDEAFLNFLSGKRISERPDFLENYLNNTEFHNLVLTEIEKRKMENTEILKSFNLIESIKNGI